MKSSRREFIGGAGSVFGLGTAACTAKVRVPWPAAFETTKNSSTLWARTDRPEPLLFEVSLHKDLSEAQQTPAQLATQEHDFVVTQEVTGLRPATRYYYRAVAPDRDWLSPQGTFRTAPTSGDSLNFVWSADLLASYKPFTILDHVRSLQPDAFLILGDTTYANHPKDNPAKDLAGFHQKHLDVRRAPQLQELLSRTSTYATWDDHDTENNTHRSHPLMLPSRAAFRDYWPVRSVPQAKEGLFRSQLWGNLAEFFILDVRSFRDPPRKTKRRTMLGKTQLRWLFEGLVASKAKYKFIVSGVPLLAPFEEDSFFGFKTERDRILRHIRKHKLRNVIVLSADFHCAWELRDKRSGVREFIAGPLAAWPFKSIKKKYVGVVTQSETFSLINTQNFGHIFITEDHGSLAYYDKHGRRRFRTRLDWGAPTSRDW